jgi:hypothetical protein
MYSQCFIFYFLLVNLLIPHLFVFNFKDVKVLRQELMSQRYTLNLLCSIFTLYLFVQSCMFMQIGQGEDNVFWHNEAITHATASSRRLVTKILKDLCTLKYALCSS